MEEFSPLEKCVILRLLLIYTGSSKKWKLKIFQFIFNFHRNIVTNCRKMQLT